MDTLTKEQRSLCMSRIRNKNTAPELAVRKILTEIGIRYRLHSAKLPGKPDVVITKRKKLIFINGCFWHQHKNCRRASAPKSNRRYWTDKLKRNIEKQKEDMKKLKKDGWKILLIWECRTGSKISLKNKIKKFLYEK